ncbi:TVP38/TMEM64 family protein [Salipaludibacillus sp. HK11]|uniref:TVP38/TMEM64 family protein n=1 Tax=Salipaludibacillus sp. HK11 TaxID=3394320 RepID=UPI0039FC311A
MNVVKWFVGLLKTFYVWYLVSLAVSICFVPWSWVEMKIYVSGFITLSVIFAVLFYVLYSLFKLPSREISLFWLKRFWSEMMIWGSLGVILLLSLFQTVGLATLPASLTRDGLLWGAFSLAQINIVIVVIVILGYVCHDLFHRLSLQKTKDEAPEHRDRRVVISSFQWQNILIVIATTFVFALLYFVHIEFQGFIHEASSKIMSGNIEVFRDYLLSFGVWAPVVSALLMIFVLVIAPPLPAFVVTFTNGLLFGAVWGTLLSWSSAMIGAALCFYIARAVGRPPVERFIPKPALEWTDRFFEKYGVHSIFLARLIPVMSFAFISYGAGLTRMRFTGYFIATGLGQLPATIIYSWLGENASGSVMYVFWAFVAVITLAVITSAFKPWFEKRVGKTDHT